ncbi:hypothetical protein SAMN06265379_1024 [Saccharicrinis carchari]|uniref:Uncharacterized protein n=1 Tax=Saccharicrinis carchari TaxID=1168039 RepID=A0A521BQZ0_SACCC|nr:hypothetical protein SAMN06265379_1024 [Saccharicrinis carchari]
MSKILNSLLYKYGSISLLKIGGTLERGFLLFYGRLLLQLTQLLTTNS